MNPPNQSETCAGLLNTANNTSKPLYARIEAVGKAIQIVDGAISRTEKISIDMSALQNLIETTRSLREPVRVRAKTINFFVLVKLFELRVDVMLHEEEWREPHAQFNLVDCIGAESAIRVFGEDHTMEPILFFTMSELRFCVARLQRHFSDEDAPQWENLVPHLLHRASLLLTFAFDADTMNVKDWRLMSSNDRYVANFAAVYELVSTFDAVHVELTKPPAVAVWCNEEQKHDTDLADAVVEFVLKKCQGDHLPSLLRIQVAEAHVFVGQRDSFAARSGEDKKGTDIAIIHEFGGRALAKRVDEVVNTPIGELWLNSTQLAPYIRSTCCAYLARQKHQPEPKVTFSVRHRGWQCNDGDFHDSRQAAMACFVRNNWDSGTLAAVAAFTKKK